MRQQAPEEYEVLLRQALHCFPSGVPFDATMYKAYTSPGHISCLFANCRRITGFGRRLLSTLSEELEQLIHVLREGLREQDIWVTP